MELSILSIDTQHNDIEYTDTQHNDIEHNDTQHNDIEHYDTELYDTLLHVEHCRYALYNDCCLY